MGSLDDLAKEEYGRRHLFWIVIIGGFAMLPFYPSEPLWIAFCLFSSAVGVSFLVWLSNWGKNSREFANKLHLEAPKDEPEFLREFQAQLHYLDVFHLITLKGEHVELFRWESGNWASEAKWSISNFGDFYFSKNVLTFMDRGVWKNHELQIPRVVKKTAREIVPPVELSEVAIHYEEIRAHRRFSAGPGISQSETFLNAIQQKRASMGCLMELEERAEFWEDGISFEGQQYLFSGNTEIEDSFLRSKEYIIFADPKWKQKIRLDVFDDEIREVKDVVTFLRKKIKAIQNSGMGKEKNQKATASLKEDPKTPQARAPRFNRFDI